jgi:hypothetical protein
MEYAQTQHEFLRNLMATGSPLLHAVVQANTTASLYLPLERVHPGALSLLALLREKCAARPNRAGRFSRCLPHLMAQTGNAGSFAWALDFRVARHRIALLPPELALKLARWFGLVRHRAEVLNLVRREEVLALREEVGEEGQRFILRRSALLPDAGRTVPDAGSSAGALPQRIRGSGFAAIAACLADAPPPVRDMVRRSAPAGLAEKLKDASGVSADTPGTSDSQIAVTAAHVYWPLLRTLLLKEVAPLWAPCFI